MSFRPKITTIISVLLATILLLFSASCDQILPVIEIPTPQGVEGIPTSTSAAIDGNITPLPVQVVTALLSPLPTPSLEDGVVVGRALTLDGRPIANTNAYLAKVYWNADRTNGVFALDVNVAPATDTQVNGDFIFTGVQEGEYTFVVGNVDRKTAVLSNTDGSAQIFKITAGQVVSLGDVRMDY